MHDDHHHDESCSHGDAACDGQEHAHAHAHAHSHVRVHVGEEGVVSHSTNTNMTGVSVVVVVAHEGVRVVAVVVTADDWCDD